MSITVTHTTHTITMPNELLDLLSNLSIIGCLANLLQQEDLYNQAKTAYHNTFERWKMQAEEQAKAKSHTNWLGGGETYRVIACNDWDQDVSFCKIYYDNKSRSEQIRDLEKVLKKINR